MSIRIQKTCDVCDNSHWECNTLCPKCGTEELARLREENESLKNKLASPPPALFILQGKVGKLKQENERLKIEHTTMVAQLLQAHAALRAVEWHSRHPKQKGADVIHAICPLCGSWPRKGHANNCLIRKALEE